MDFRARPMPHQLRTGRFLPSSSSCERHLFVPTCSHGERTPVWCPQQVELRRTMANFQFGHVGHRQIVLRAPSRLRGRCVLLHFPRRTPFFPALPQRKLHGGGHKHQEGGHTSSCARSRREAIGGDAEQMGSQPCDVDIARQAPEPPWVRVGAFAVSSLVQTSRACDAQDGSRWSKHPTTVARTP